MSEQPKGIPAKRRRWPRRVLVVFLVLAAVYTAYRYTLHRMVEAKLDEIRKQGYPVTLAELDKWYPQVPKQENAADDYLQAFQRYVRTESDKNLPIVGLARTPRRSAPLSPEMKEGIADYLLRNQAALDLLHKAATMKSCRYPYNLSGPDKMPGSLPKTFVPARQGTLLLYLEALSSSANGDGLRAAKSITASVALTESLKDRSLLISYLVGQACLRLTVSSLEEALNRTAFTEQQLAELSDAFHQVGTADWFTRAVIGERAWANAEWQEIRTGRTPAKASMLVSMDNTGFPRGWQPLNRGLAIIYRPSGFVDLDYLGCLSLCADFLSTTNIAFPRRLNQIDSIERRQALFAVMPIAKMLADLFGTTARIEARLQGHLQGVNASLAVERFRIATGTLPVSLGHLVPKFLDAAPADPFDGQPLRYKKLAKGYAVYSVGEDGKDDGGDEEKDITFTVER